MQFNTEKMMSPIAVMVLLLLPAVSDSQRITGFSVVDLENAGLVEYVSGTRQISGDKPLTLQLYGVDLQAGLKLAVTTEAGEYGDKCVFHVTDTPSDIQTSSEYTATTDTKLPLSDGKLMYLCIQTNTSGFIHQGSDKHLTFTTKLIKKYLMPIPIQAILVTLLLLLSGLFSGLNLGLMSLGRTDLEIIEAAGSNTEKRHAKKIKPVRKRGNFLLCTLLLGNVLVNNSLTILLDNLLGGGGVYAIIGSTLGIVFFGEIIPQALCSRHGLAVGARTLWITKIFMIITFPLSFPISLLLDKILGDEIGNVYNRDKLNALIRVTNDQNELVHDEVKIISGALELTQKTVRDVMTPLPDIFMIEYEAVMDFDTISEIIRQGYTRVPVYEKERTNVVAVLNVKDLAFVDPDDKIPLKSVCKFYQRQVKHVPQTHTLDLMLQIFKEGNTHLAFVQSVDSSDADQPAESAEILGIVTLEDVIEEIIQAEIVDETDVVTDNRQKARRTLKRQDFSEFLRPQEHNQPLSAQMSLATFSFLHTSVDAFKPDQLSEHVLQRLLKQPDLVHTTHDDTDYIYKQGRAADYFVLVLEGQGEVKVGEEGMKFETSPFMFFGVRSLTNVTSSHQNSFSSLQDDYIPDFSLRPRPGSILRYLRVTRASYCAAHQATKLENMLGTSRRPTEADISSSQTDPDLTSTKPKQVTSNEVTTNEVTSNEVTPNEVTSNEVNGVRPNTDDKPEEQVGESEVSVAGSEVEKTTEADSGGKHSDDGEQHPLLPH